MGFRNLGLSDKVYEGVVAMGYSDPTPIQLRSIPPLLEGRDLIGSAQTGTGKTAAFALPILTKLERGGSFRVLVLEPTRELAAQVETAFRDYARFTDIEVAAIFGGVGYGKQREAIKSKVDIIVATPGRLLDFIGQGELSLKKIEYLVLDEMDRMLDMGFMPDVRRIVGNCAKQRQTMLFSATMPPEIEGLTKWVLTDPEVIEIGVRQSPAETVRHAVYPVARDQKFDLMLALLERANFDSVLIFTRTKQGADMIANQLKKANHSVALLHSNRTQNERIEALDGFKSGKYEMMVATDIASRGLDIAGVSHVINYDAPQHAEDYVHRIGRTGRAQNVGDAYTIYTAEEATHMQQIERFIGQRIERLKLDGFPYKFTALFQDEDGVAGTMRGGGGASGRVSFGGRRRRRR